MERYGSNSEDKLITESNYYHYYNYFNQTIIIIIIVLSVCNYAVQTDKTALYRLSTYTNK